ncbi:PadR family transcriptional regulator [Geminocystis sp. NIES-3709]|uniref:PadR family transcriptional regulator n=1 Tax=Geminocystis sp. NIES-3709 TaxID=1617448 RepID=UPI0005FC71DA|nr:PadR family transcriptional regulator [Geminocystis sp. NIES-3709]BAQ65945.1 transcriptional regulator [Geminocystis sp. NIES-3709]
MLELATLGLLQKEPLHGYRLKQQMELFMSGCISVNYGAIYPLLRRLEERELIKVLTEQEDSIITRKIYSITKKGVLKWKEKMLEHPQESWVNARSRFMIKFFFFTYLEPQERLKLLQHRLIICQLQLENKEKELNIVSDDRDPYQLEAWRRCRWAIEDEIKWLNIQVAMAKNKSV